MANIHSSSVIEPTAEIADDVQIGPFCYVGPNVKIGSGSRLLAHVNLDGNTTIGENCMFHPMVVIGQPAQDPTFNNPEARIVIGNDNTFREACTVHLPKTENPTSVGDRCFFMHNTHIAHDVIIADDVITASNATFGGHVEIGRKAFIGGCTACHQFVRIGAYAMLGGVSKAAQDVPPYTLGHGNPIEAFGLNIVGLKRAGFSPDTRKSLKAAYKIFYQEKLSNKAALAKVKNELLPSLKDEALSCVQELYDFAASSKRGIISQGDKNSKHI